MDEEFENELSQFLEKTLEFNDVEMGGYIVSCDGYEIKITDKDDAYFYRSASYRIIKHEDKWTLEIIYQKKVWRKEIITLGYFVDHIGIFKSFIVDVVKVILRSFK